MSSEAAQEDVDYGPDMTLVADWACKTCGAEDGGGGGGDGGGGGVGSRS